MKDFPPEMLSYFSEFINAREAVRLAKESGAPRPWAKPGTYQEVLNAWRFCNVNRCDDVVTKWVFQNLILKGLTIKQLALRLSVGRFINRPSTLQALIDGRVFDRPGFRGDVFISVMERLMAGKGSVYTGAYMIRAGTGEDAEMPKHEYLVKRVFDPLLLVLSKWESLGIWGITCEWWDQTLGGIFGMGDFMRNQIITDMKYSPILCNAPDWDQFCLAGPGTNRGLSRVLGENLTASRDPKVSSLLLKRLRYKLFVNGEKLSPIFNDLNNLSNCLCEFDKAERVRHGEGTPRSRYTPA